MLLLSLFAMPLHAGTNLISNGNAAAGLTGWTFVSVGSGWSAGDAFYCTYACSGSDSCASYNRMYQEVNLLSNPVYNYSAAYLDSAPELVANASVKDITNTGPTPYDMYGVKVQIRDSSHNAIATYDTGLQKIYESSGWLLLSHGFTGYGPGARYLYFEMYGYDRGYWSGNYGPVFTNATAYFTSEAPSPGTMPVYSNFSGSTTDFSSASNLSSIPGLVLERQGRGRIAFPASHSVDADAEDYDANVLMEPGFVSVNSSGLHSSFNSSASVSLNASGIYSGAAAPVIYYYPGFASGWPDIVQNGAPCGEARCTGVSWNQSSGIVTFNVSGFSGYAIYNGSGAQVAWGANGTLAINITSTNQISIYTSSSANNSALSFVPAVPPAGGFIILASNESSNVTGGDTGFIVENQGNVNVSLTVSSDKGAAGFIGGSAPLFQVFGLEKEAGSCQSISGAAQGLGALPVVVCPSLGFSDSRDTLWAYVLVRISSDSPPRGNTATLTFTSTQA